MKKFLLAAGCMLAFPLTSYAQMSAGSPASIPATTVSPANSNTPSMLSATDKEFISAAAVAGIAEVSDGELAEQKGGSNIKQIATQMVTDHTKANNQLAALSQQQGDPAPARTDAKHLQISQSLQDKSGSAFDTAYLQTELQGHVTTIALFKKEASSGSNPQLKNFAQMTLPTLEEHLSMIKSAQQS
jgi:putative membrane protein